MSDESSVPCVADFFSREDAARLLDEPEGPAVPAGIEVIDTHVHLFPPRVFEAIWRWFDKNAWTVRYRLYTEQTIEFLRSRGVSKFVALHYSHKPGMAAELNRYAALAARAHPQIIPFATVMPGEVDAKEILAEAFGKLGLRGVKLHCHVQRMAADDPRLDEVYKICAEADKPIVIHSGREPSFPAYGVDTRALCASAQIDRVMQRHPRLKLIVAHLGADEFDDYSALLDVHENLFLDTTMAISGLFKKGPPASLFPAKASRILYGTDFPALPYAWDRELKKMLALEIPRADRDAMLSGNARKLFA